MQMKIAKRVTARKSFLLLTILLVGVLALASVYLMHPVGGGLLPIQKVLHSLSWRPQLYLRKAEGGIPDLSWSELWQLTRPGSGFGLKSVIEEGRSVEGGIINPYKGGDDQKAGARFFRESCGACHGRDGAGGRGPSLLRSGFKEGDSDLAIYRVLRDGIPGTAMVPAHLSLVERWQVIGYLRTLQRYSAAPTEKARIDVRVTSEQLQASERSPDEWLTYSRSLSGQRYSSLTEITPAKVSQLRIRWVHQSTSTGFKFEATPLVVNGTIFTTEPPASVIALDGRSGDVIWSYERKLPAELPACCGLVNRGLAILGSSLFFGSLDGYLIAINANNGEVIWQTKVSNPGDGFTITGAPLIVDNSVVVGLSGGEYGVRGFLAAYDAETGQRKWKFDTIPGPGERGHDTWENDGWRTGGGPTWVTGSYDPSLGLLFWGVGNPSPVYLGDVRPGDNLFTNSVIALRAESGKLAWYFQFTPHDEHDWDAAQTPILADAFIGGINRKVVCWPNRNGFYYVLDRTSGEFVLGVPFVEQNWATGLDAGGRPILADVGNVTIGGHLTRPSVAGATNWQPSAFDPKQGLVFIPAIEGASIFTKSSQPTRGEHGLFLGSGFGGGAASGSPVSFVRALDAATGAKRWEYRSPSGKSDDFSGLLATAGGVVFGASGGTVFALNAATGDELWRVFLGGETRAAPISFALDGRQVILVSAGRDLFAFGL